MVQLIVANMSRPLNAHYEADLVFLRSHDRIGLNPLDEVVSMDGGENDGMYVYVLRYVGNDFEDE